MTLEIVWMKFHALRISIGYIPGRKNIMAGQSSCHDQFILTEYHSFLECPWKSAFCVGDQWLISLPCRGSTSSNFYMVLVPYPMAWKRDALRTSWNHLEVCAFPLFALIQRAINWMMMSSGLTVILVAPMWLHRKWLLNFLFRLVDNPLQLPLVWNLLVQPHEIPSKPEHN